MPAGSVPNFAFAALATSVGTSFNCASLTGDDNVGAVTLSVEPSAAASALAVPVALGETGVAALRLHAMASAIIAALTVSVVLLDIQKLLRCFTFCLVDFDRRARLLRAATALVAASGRAAAPRRTDLEHDDVLLPEGHGR